MRRARARRFKTWEGLVRRKKEKCRGWGMKVFLITPLHVGREYGIIRAIDSKQKKEILHL